MQNYDYARASDIYFAAHTADPDDPMPEWLVEMNKQFTVIDGRLMWRDPMSCSEGLNENYTRISKDRFSLIFSNKFTRLRSPRTGKLRAVSLDKAWLAHPNHKIGQ